MNEYNYNKDLISLTTEYITFPPREGCISLDLMADDPDDTDEKLLQDFQNIFYDLAAIFAKNHTVLYFAPYKKIKFESKNWLLGNWKPGKYAIKGETSKLKQFLIDAKWDNGLYADIIDYSEKKLLWWNERYYSKNLFILQENFDINLFKKTNMNNADEGHYGSFVSVFNDSQIANLDDSKNTILHYVKEEPPIIEIAADIVLPRIGISLDAKYIQKEQCIATIKEIAKKYNKTLEVNI